MSESFEKSLEALRELEAKEAYLRHRKRALEALELSHSNEEWVECRTLGSRATHSAIKQWVRNQNNKNTRYFFTKREEDDRWGYVQCTDLRIVRHGSDELYERFIVVDVKGCILKKEGGYTVRDPTARFETWCRLYRSEKPGWHVHYVDMIIRHVWPAKRTLFMFPYGKSDNPTLSLTAEEKHPDKLCLFFETPQGGMFG